jgi:hypothetical protein
MLIFEINGRSAIPVRAIPFVTGGSFDAQQIIDLFYDPESHDVGPWAASPDATFAAPRAFRVDAQGTITPVAATSWSLPRERSPYRSKAAPDSPEELALLPPAVFVWRDEFKPFYESFAWDAAGVRTPPAGAFGWDEEAMLTKSQEDLVWEAFGARRPATISDGQGLTSESAQVALSPNEALLVRKTKLSQKGVDPILNARAAEIANVMRAETGRWPTKGGVAKRLSAENGMDEKTVSRRIRKTW